MRLFTVSAALLFSTAAHAAPLTIATDIPPVHALALMVMGDRGQAELLMDQGGDAHDFQLRPSQARLISVADGIIWTGPELAFWLDSTLEAMDREDSALALLHVDGTHERIIGEEDHNDHDAHDAHDNHDDHGHEEDHHEAEHSDHEGHDHSGLDPHAWLSPENGQKWLGAIAEYLTNLDPEGADTYAANAKAAQDRLASLEADISATLAPYQDQGIVVFHDAYGYFTDHFGIKVTGTIASSEAATPGARHLSDLRDHITEDGVTCIFSEPQHDPAYIQAITKELNLRSGVLDPMGSTLPAGPDLYPQLLKNLADSIATCLKG